MTVLHRDRGQFTLLLDIDDVLPAETAPPESTPQHQTHQCGDVTVHLDAPTIAGATATLLWWTNHDGSTDAVLRQGAPDPDGDAASTMLEVFPLLRVMLGDTHPTEVAYRHRAQRLFGEAVPLIHEHLAKTAIDVTDSGSVEDQPFLTQLAWRSLGVAHTIHPTVREFMNAYSPTQAAVWLRGGFDTIISVKHWTDAVRTGKRGWSAREATIDDAVTQFAWCAAGIAPRDVATWTKAATWITADGRPVHLQPWLVGALRRSGLRPAQIPTLIAEAGDGDIEAAAADGALPEVAAKARAIVDRLGFESPERFALFMLAGFSRGQALTADFPNRVPDEALRLLGGLRPDEALWPTAT